MPALTSNTLVKQVDLPVWEWCRFAPAVSSAVSSTCSADNPDFLQTEHGRYLYYLISSTQFVRYDTWTDMYQLLTPPPLAPFNFSAMKLAGAYGPEGKVIAAGSSTVTVPAIFMGAMLDYDIVIISGTGAGQRRKIVSVAQPVVHDSGIATAVSNVLGNITMQDTVKTWTFNQWAGYNLRITANAGVGQYRQILSNTANNLILGDSTQMNMRLNNPAIFSPTIAAPSNSTYAIESQVVTVDSPWAVTPDTTSVFRIQSGMIMLTTANAATATAPFYTTQLYDILRDTWYILPTMTNILAAGATDLSLERMSENATIWANGKATGGTTTTLIDASMGVDRKAWDTDEWAGYWVYFYSGTGEGQIRQISSNTGTTLTWIATGTAPTATTRYHIVGFDAGTATSGGASTLTDSTKSWGGNRWANYAVRILAGTGAGQVLPIASNTAQALTVVGAWATNPDSTSVYAIQGDPDKAYLFAGGIAAAPIINFSSQVQTFGRQLDWGIARSASASVAGYQPISITTLANATTTATVTTAHPHQFRVGELVTVRGATDANFNVTNVAIATVPSATTFTYTMAGTPAATTIPGTQTTTTLTDASKNWVINEHAGRLVYMYTATPTAASGSTAGQVVRISANSATTLTFANAVTTSANGISRYVICSTSAIGAIDSGVATGGTTTTVIDTTKNWVANIHAGKRCRITSTTGGPIEVVISANNNNTLTVGTLPAAPTANATTYVILEPTAKGAGANANWAFGTSDPDYRGRYMYCTRGGAVNGFDRWDVTTDRFALMPTSPLTETLTTGTMTAYDGRDRIYFHKDNTQRVYSLNVVTANVNGATIYPYAPPTAVLGNRMEIFETKDGLKYLWLNRASFAECFKCLLFW
jgi:hypothetical protein